MLRLFIVAAALLLPACATGMSKKECLAADWRAIGYEDGAAGRDISAASARRASCANNAKTTLDMDQYLAGREEGLGEFCRPANAFDYGARGGRYAGACEGRDERVFVEAFEKGARLHALVLARDHALGALIEAERRLDRIEAEITHHEAALVSPTTPHLERADHLLAVKDARDARLRARDARSDRANEHDRAEYELEAYRRRLAGFDEAVRASTASY